MPLSQAEHSRLNIEYFDRLQAFAATIPDYEVAVNSDAARAVVVVPQIARFIERTPNGPQIGYYFVKNPEVLLNIQQLPPHRMMEELWKLASKFQVVALRGDPT